MNEREELEALRRLAALEVKAAGSTGTPVPPGASANRGGGAGGVFMGLRDPIDAGAQLLSRGVDAAVGGINSLTGLNLPRPDVAAVDRSVNAANAEYDASRKLAGRDGIDFARIGGNVINPANLAGAKVLQGANTARQIAMRGAAAGAIGGGLQPVIGEDDQANFGGSKAIQTGGGAAAGAVLGPLANRIGEGLAPYVSAAARRLKGADDATLRQEAISLFDSWAGSQQAMQDVGVDLAQIPASIRKSVQDQVYAALKSGRQVDPAALIRKADFEALGIQPTQGQITRNPTQFARERNLRGVEGAGEPLAERFAQQGNQLQNALNVRGANQALEPDLAGNVLMQALREADDPVRTAVTKAYGAARQSSGKDADLWRPELSQDAQSILENYGDRVPAAVVDRLRSFGILGNPTEKQLFNFDAADKLLKQINSLQGSDRATNSALGELRNAVKRAISAPGGAADPYAPARGMAAARFKVLEETPGLAAALDNEVPDTFVRKFLIGGDSKSVNNLMKVLGGNEEAADQARAQVASYLRDKGFGVNAAGDAPFAQASFNKALKDIGETKLVAIFGKDGADQLRTVGRVGAYIKSQPEGSAVNNSNTAGAVMNLLSGLSGRFGSLPVVNMARDSFRSFGNERFANRALSGQAPELPAEMSGEARNQLLRLLVGPAAVAGGAAAGALGQ